MTQKLAEGIQRFRKDAFKNLQMTFASLANDQKPEALFITCSDSRIDPNLITDTDPGEIFVLRNAGNIVPPHGVPSSEEATIEFAVTKLKVKDIIICGHSDCGAMKGVLHPEALGALPAVAAFLTHAEATRRIVQDQCGNLNDAQKLDAAVRANVLVQLENLRTHPAVASRLARGDLNLHGWVYSIQSGEIAAYDSEQGQFVPIAADYQPHPLPGMRIGDPQAL